MRRRKGERLLIPTPGKNARIAVCGAYRYPDGPFRATYGPKSVTTALFVDLVHVLIKRAKRTGRRIVLVLDNGGAFRAKRSEAELSEAKPGVVPFWLPKYSAEKLNRIENLWQHMKNDYFSRMLVERREQFFAAAMQLLRALEKQGALKKLFGASLPT